MKEPAGSEPPVRKSTGPKPELAQTALRVSPEVMDALDAWVVKLNAKSHARWSRNGLLIAIIERALRERGESGEEP